MNNTLTRAIRTFVMTRVDATDVTREVKNTQVVIEKMVDSIANELVQANSTTFGNSAREIGGNIYNSILDYCCRYQEDGYHKGIADGMQINGMINFPATIERGC